MHSSLLGWTCLLGTALIWVAASFLAQHLVSGEQPSLHPLLLCYICTSLFSLYLPIIALKRTWLHRRSSARGEQQPLLGAGGQGRDGVDHAVLFPETSRLGACCKVLPVACVWFIAQYTFTLSLANTSVTSNTILSSSSSMWTLLTSALVLRERITCIKLAAVAAVMAGTSMVTLADSSEAAAAGGPDHSLWGDVLCVFSAMCYSCYTVTMQRQLREDDPELPAQFFGLVGVMTALLGLPGVLALHCLGVYNITALDPQALGLAVLNGLMDYVCGDYLWARAVLLLGSTVATLGTSVQIPVATLADVVLGHPHWMDSPRAVALTATGTLLILGGVTGVNWDPRGRQRAAADQYGSGTASATAGAAAVPLLQEADFPPVV